DEFFAAIRACYNRRTEEPEWERLTFCLLGVATPSDLIQDTRTTPFNIGRRIDLTDFSPAEAAPLARGLAGPTPPPAPGDRPPPLPALRPKRGSPVLQGEGGHAPIAPPQVVQGKAAPPSLVG